MPGESSPEFILTPLDIRVPLIGFLDQAGAVTLLLSYILGFKAQVARAEFLPDVAGAGAGATQAIRIRKGNATGTILATVTPTLANHVLGGPGVVSGNVAAALDEAAKLVDTGTISITKDAGTVFSAGGGTLRVWLRQRPQARS